MDCNYILILVVFYIVALTFVMKKHFHYIGYILLLIVYLLNFLYIVINRDIFSKAIDILIPITGGLFSKNNFIKVSVLIIGFFSLYSLIRMIDTYNYLINTNQTYDITLSKYHQKNMNRFNISFIVSTIALIVLLFLLSIPITNPMIIFALIIISLISTFLEIGFSTSFSAMKYDFISRYSKDIQSKYEVENILAKV